MSAARKSARFRFSLSVLPQIVALIGAGIFYAWRFGSSPTGLSHEDTLALAQSHSLNSIKLDPTNAPHKLLQHLFLHFWPDSLIAARAPSLILGLIFLICVYYLLRRWFGSTIGLIAGILAVTVPWLALSFREVLPTVSLLFPVTVGASLIALQRSTRHKAAWLFVVALTASLSLYTPGVIWLLLVATLLGGRVFVKSLSEIKVRAKAGALIFGLAILSPMVWAAVQKPSLLKTAAGLPAHWPNTLALVKALGWSALALIWRTPYHDDWFLGRLPVLNLTAVVLAALGLYAMLRLARPKAILLVTVTTVSLLLEALNSNLTFELLLLPSLFVFMAAGLRYLYFEWHGVFPTNPVPKYFALILITVVVGLNAFFGVRYTLSAWPQNDQTRSAYHAKI